MHGAAGPGGAAQRDRSHLEQVDQRLAAREHAVAFEQRLAFERLEREILRQRVDEILIGYGLRQFRLLSSVLSSSSLAAGLPSDLELENAMRQSAGHSRPPLGMESRDVRRQEIPAIRSNVEAVSDRFMDRTIPQAVTLLLREEGGPLHVNELYNRLLEGGFRFTGANPTISVAVSLNRNNRFRKVSPGTFDLMIRDASKAS